VFSCPRDVLIYVFSPDSSIDFFVPEYVLTTLC
jgi:hypothetical protein